MPKKLSPEHIAKMKAGAERARAEKMAAKMSALANPTVETPFPEPAPVPVEEFPPVVTVPFETPRRKRELGGFNKGRYLVFPSRASESKNLRSRKIVKPACQVPEVQEYKGSFKTNMTTGPCQLQVFHEPMRQFDWWKTCTHGPEYDSAGNHIPAEDRPYYEHSTEYVKRPKSVGSDGRVEWEEYEVLRTQLRVADVSLDIRNNSGRAMEYWQARGGRPVEYFGLRTYCDYRGCFSQDLTQFTNGQFCTVMHAKLVKVYELGDILPIAWDSKDSIHPSTDARNRMLRGVAV